MSRTQLTVAVLAGAGALTWLVAVWPSRERSETDTAAPPPAPAESPAPTRAAAPVRTTQPPPAQPAPADTSQPTAAPAAEASVDGPWNAPAGPLDEYRDQFQNDTRDPGAQAAEERVRAAFAADPASAALLRSVLCRKSTCRAVLSLGPEQLAPYRAAISRSSDGFETTLASLPVAPLDPAQPRLLEIYLKRKPVAE